jgi:TonB family protein
MRFHPKGFERFSNYLLLRKLGTNCLGELWRAAPIGANALGPPIALHRFDFPADERWTLAAETCNALARELDATSVAPGQRAAVESGRPFLVHDYPGGRPLSIVAARAFRDDTAPMPLPVDLALATGEKLALALSVTHAVRHNGVRATHGALLPETVWIGEEGDIRVAGQGLGPAVLPLLAARGTGARIRPYIAPELTAGSAPTQQGDVYSACAILYLLLTGKPLPDGNASGAASAALLAVSGDPLPQELAAILLRGLHADPAARYPSGAELLQDISRLLHSGSYAATTFNLAFYLQSLLRNDLQAERKERAAEEALDPAPYLQPETLPPAEVTGEQGDARAPVRRTALAAALLLVAVAGAGAVYYATRQTPARAAEPHAGGTAALPTPAPAEAVDAPLPPELAPQLSEETIDTAAAFEQEVNRRLRAEMTKLQGQFDEEERRRKATERPEPMLTRITNVPEPAATPVPTPLPVPESTPAAQQQPVGAVSEAPARELAREGQLFDVGEVDETPKVVRSTPPSYPPIAARQKMEGAVIVTALISETGRVLDVRLLRGDTRRVGFDEAALKAVRDWQFTPATKDGQRVRTWMPVNVAFRLQR